MKLQKLWYVRRDGVLSGPFPAKLIGRELMVGRFKPGDEASTDQVFWSPIEETPELLPRFSVKNRIIGPANSPLDWERERQQAARRWADERHQRDRRGPHLRAPVGKLRGRDRRIRHESAEWAALRLRHAEWEGEQKRRRDRFVGVGMVLIALLALALFAVWRLPPTHPIKVDFQGSSVACSEPASDQVNWSGCDKNGAWLKGVDLSSAMLRETHFNAANLSHSDLSYANLTASDLSFANLTQAKLVSANLAGADLTYAELRDADLRYADLRGAKLDAASLIGARLDNATWTDGRTCVAISVGDCK